jgi:hypothetical protein
MRSVVSLSEYPVVLSTPEYTQLVDYYPHIRVAENGVIARF